MKYSSEYMHVAILLACFLCAILIPFELFLFAYAILGPLHYLTEIYWLHTKSYFIGFSVSPYLVVIGVGMFLLFASLLPGLLPEFLVVLIFLCVYFFIIFEKLAPQMLALSGSILVLMSILLFLEYDLYFAIISLLILTIVHVYIFTLLFMIQAAMRHSLWVYYLAPAVHIFLGILCIFLPPTLWFMTEYSQGVFSNINFSFSQTFYEVGAIFFGDTGNDVQDFLASPEGLAISRLFAFAYTYHYVNWFFKVKTIGWAKISFASSFVILCCWIMSIALYVYDYILGMAALAFLSVLHVILEFPLNARSLKSICVKLLNIK